MSEQTTKPPNHFKDIPPGTDWVIRVRFEADGIAADALLDAIGDAVNAQGLSDVTISMGREP